MTSDISSNTINLVLNELIKIKSKRDGVKFTSSKLAHELDLPRSSISRLMHPDKDKRMTNPTIGTLIKIVDFFKADGIPVSIDDFVGTRKTIVNVQEQALEPLTHTKTVPVCNWYGGQEQSDIRINVCENEQNINLIAFIAEEDFKPIFKKGSVFIVNKDVRPENDNIVGIKLEVDGKILIKKLHKNNNRLFVSRFENDLEEIELSPEQYYDIIGVVVQIIAKT